MDIARDSALALVQWYEENKRDLPWRRTGDPYEIWISEIMLQQTRIETVIDYFLRFRDALPALKDLADCPEDRLLKLWEGLGYYSRVRNMQKCARYLADHGRDSLPASYEELLKLPGIGPYTAGAVSSIAFGIPRPAVDGNVLRVLARLFAVQEDIRSTAVKRTMEDTINRFYAGNPDLCADSSFVSSFTQGLMELGALVCIPNGIPRCAQCPWGSVCLARAQDAVDTIPFRSASKERRVIPMTVFIVYDGLRITLQRRPEKGLLAGLYEFPHTEGHLDAEESRKYLQRSGISAVHMEALQDRKHVFTHLVWDMKGWLVQAAHIPDSVPAVPLAEFPDYALPAAFDEYRKAAMSRIVVC